MAGELAGKSVAFITANEGVEQAELTCPWEAVKRAGATPVLVAPSAGKVQAFNHLDPADTFAVDKLTGEVSVEEFDALMGPDQLPGGKLVPEPPDGQHFCMPRAISPIARACPVGR